MENHNLDDKTQLDNLDKQAVEERLLAGKFKSKDALIESTATLVKQVEGRDMTPTEILNLATKPEEDLESVYKGLERQFHTSRPQKKEEENAGGEVEEAYRVLDAWAQERGYVRKDELKAQEYEENELGAYFVQNPAAKDREQLIRTLAKTNGFQDKSFADIDNFIIGQIPQAKASVQRKEKLGDSMTEEDNFSLERIRAAAQRAGRATFYNK